MNNNFCLSECEYLNITEQQQDALGKEGRMINHRCNKYNVPLYHRSTHPKLFKCEECLKESII